MTEFRFSIDVPVRNEWANVERLRTSVQGCFLAVFSDLEGSHALSMVTGELLENAIKHGHWTEAGGMFRLRVFGDRNMGCVCVENPIASPPQGQRVAELVARLKSFPSAAEAYQARLLEVSLSPEAEKSGLGLARILYEGGCSLACEVEGTLVRMTARLDF
jgi:two-component sensor histidine kinase